MKDIANNSLQFDVLVIGSGVAGLVVALDLADKAQVAIISKTQLRSGSSLWAQGGIAAVLDTQDSLESHCEDTLNTGAGLCNVDVVKHIVGKGKESIEWLVCKGVHFNREQGQYHLTREGGHSARRVVHNADVTGQAIISSLMDQIDTHPNIHCFDNHIAIDIIQTETQGVKISCAGAYVLNINNDRVVSFNAKCTVLATGGASKTYLYTSNPDGASGDGIAMAWRAGCRVANMEFQQFHPTCLYHTKAKSALISEALRGEGATLHLPDGESFMQRFDERKELAPRDIVARAIDHEMKRLGIDHVYLDISHKSSDFIQSHFPSAYSTGLKYGIDICHEPIPVVPAAHYTCGGVMTGLQGQTDLAHLYAVGEVAHTGMHGANRMASNSLLECVVLARNAAQDIANNLDNISLTETARAWDESRVTDSDEDVIISHNWEELRHFMWDYVGIVRSHKRVERAQHRNKLLQKEIHEYYSNYKVSNDLIELRNLAVCSHLMIHSALRRKESRGLHYMIDSPDRDSIARNTVLVPINFADQDTIVSNQSMSM